MRAVVVSFVAVTVVALATPAVALPPEDVAGYCRGIYPQLPFQLRCLSLERAAQERLTSARGAVDPAVWVRCQGASPSWSAMEACLGQSASLGAPQPAPGAVAPGGGPLTPPDPRDDARRDAAEGAAAPPDAARGATPPTAPPPATAVGSPSTIILGPQASQIFPSPPENRPTRPVSEAEADRQLRGVLERVGATTARCTKKQYGPGWVIVCD